MKITNTEGLRRLVRSAKRRGYNKQIDLKMVNNIVDEEGIHVLRDWLLHEHKGGLLCEPHVRCQVYIKCKGTFDPAVAWLDVELKAFNALTDSEVVQDSIDRASSGDEETPDYAVVGTV